MKRFGLPVLLSAIYVTAMFFVFSSDYGKENTFLYPDTGQEIPDSPSSDGDLVIEPTPSPKTVTSPPTDSTGVIDLPTESEDPEKEIPTQPEPNHHSPEASDGE